MDERPVAAATQPASPAPNPVALARPRPGFKQPRSSGVPQRPRPLPQVLPAINRSTEPAASSPVTSQVTGGSSGANQQAQRPTAQAQPLLRRVSLSAPPSQPSQLALRQPVALRRPFTPPALSRPDGNAGSAQLAAAAPAAQRVLVGLKRQLDEDVCDEPTSEDPASESPAASGSAIAEQPPAPPATPPRRTKKACASRHVTFDISKNQMISPAASPVASPGTPPLAGADEADGQDSMQLCTDAATDQQQVSSTDTAASAAVLPLPLSSVPAADADTDVVMTAAACNDSDSSGRQSSSEVNISDDSAQALSEAVTTGASSASADTAAAGVGQCDSSVASSSDPLNTCSSEAPAVASMPATDKPDVMQQSDERNDESGQLQRCAALDTGSAAVLDGVNSVDTGTVTTARKMSSEQCAEAAVVVTSVLGDCVELTASSTSDVVASAVSSPEAEITEHEQKTDSSITSSNGEITSLLEPTICMAAMTTAVSASDDSSLKGQGSVAYAANSGSVKTESALADQDAAVSKEVRAVLDAVIQNISATMVAETPSADMAASTTAEDSDSAVAAVQAHGGESAVDIASVVSKTDCDVGDTSTLTAVGDVTEAAMDLVASEAAGDAKATTAAAVTDDQRDIAVTGVLDDSAANAASAVADKAVHDGMEATARNDTDADSCDTTTEVVAERTAELVVDAADSNRTASLVNVAAATDAAVDDMDVVAADTSVDKGDSGVVDDVMASTAIADEAAVSATDASTDAGKPVDLLLADSLNSDDNNNNSKCTATADEAGTAVAAAGVSPAFHVTASATQSSSQNCVSPAPQPGDAITTDAASVISVADAANSVTASVAQVSEHNGEGLVSTVTTDTAAGEGAAISLPLTTADSSSVSSMVDGQANTLRLISSTESTAEKLQPQTDVAAVDSLAVVVKSSSKEKHVGSGDVAAGCEQRDATDNTTILDELVNTVSAEARDGATSVSQQQRELLDTPAVTAESVNTASSTTDSSSTPADAAMICSDAMDISGDSNINSSTTITKATLDTTISTSIAVGASDTAATAAEPVQALPPAKPAQPLTLKRKAVEQTSAAAEAVTAAAEGLDETAVLRAEVSAHKRQRQVLVQAVTEEAERKKAEEVAFLQRAFDQQLERAVAKAAAEAVAAAAAVADEAAEDMELAREVAEHELHSTVSASSNSGSSSSVVKPVATANSTERAALDQLYAESNAQQEYATEVVRQCHGEVRQAATELRGQWARDRRTVEEIIREDFAGQRELLVLVEAMRGELMVSATATTA
jgi:trimeric autotransporter adhesin